MPYIDIVQPEDATGELAIIYQSITEKRGKIAEVHKIQSLNPQTIMDHMNLYMTLMYGKSPVRRVDRELVGVVVSQSNQCRYCTIHHAEAVNHYWKDQGRLDQLTTDFRSVELSAEQYALCEYAEQLTLNPGSCADGKAVGLLKDAGLSDRKILDVTAICAYFNFVNRLVLSLGVYLEEDGGKGYKFGE
jgi:uncharacterized peroxidase-related enzyme